MTPTNDLVSFWPAILKGDASAVLGLFADPSSAILDDPIYFGVSGAAAITERVAQLHSFFVSRVHPSAKDGLRHLSTLVSSQRVVAEHSLHLGDGYIWNEGKQIGEESKDLHLPVALVGHRLGEKFSRIHIYFGTWSILKGRNVLRAGNFFKPEALPPHPILDKYFESLKSGDVAGVMSTFEVDGYFREPAGNAACGTDAVCAHYTHILSQGGIGVQRLNATTDGDTTAYEIQSVTWGKDVMPTPQAGVAVYAIGRNGLIRAARVYDSVVPPV